MTRRERAQRKISKLESGARQASIRATSQRNPLGRAAIRSGQVAADRYRKANQMKLALQDREESAKREEAKKRKMQKDWWRNSRKDGA